MRKTKNKSPGETGVWFSGMGLSLGIIMIVGLLGVIFVKGVEVFWPKRVVEVSLSFKPGQSEKILGEKILEQDKKILSAQGKTVKEWQLFLGNREVLGEAFRFVLVDQIKSQTYPKNAVVLERMEYGDAMGYPVSLNLAGEGTLLVGDAGFLEKFSQVVSNSRQRWKKIRHLEKVKIGNINRQMEKLRFRQAETSDAGKLDQIKIQKQKLEKQYQSLAQQAQSLRQRQRQDQLKLRLAGGQEQDIELGQILHFYYPNQLNFFSRVSLFAQNLGRFLWEEPREANTEGGIYPAIFGTFVMTVLMTLVVMPFGVVAAIYLHEYAKQGLLLRLVRIAVNNLAGVPSIVFGVFGLGFFVYMVGGTVDSLFFSHKLPTPTFGTGGLLWASLTLALMTVPVVIVSTEEALSSVSRGIREGALACGASKWQTIQKVLLPAAAPGVLTGAILAMARGAGEVAPLMLVGVVKLAPTLPINGVFPYLHLDQKFMHLGFHIFDLGFQSPDSEAAKPMVFATTLVLILLVLLLNLGAIVLRERLRKKYATGSF